MTKLLVSVTDEEEAIEAVRGGAHIIDVKNPLEGSLGAPHPLVIQRVRRTVPREIPVSTATGDMPNLPGTAALAALGAVFSGANIVKVGLLGCKSEDEAIELMKEVVIAVKLYDPETMVVAAAYADAERVGSVNAQLIPEIAKKSGADIAMIDTAVKDGKPLFKFIPPEEIESLIRAAHDLGLMMALAGSLSKDEVRRCVELGADVVGVRTAACRGHDRLNGRICSELVRSLVVAIKETELVSRSPGLR